MAQVTFKCGHKGTAKGRDKYFAKGSLCYDCYKQQRNAPATQEQNAEMRERAEEAAAMSEIHAH